MPSQDRPIELAYYEVVSPTSILENPIKYDLAQVRLQRTHNGRQQRKALFDKARFVLDGTNSKHRPESESEKSTLSDSTQLSTPSSVTWSPPPTPGIHPRDILPPANKQCDPSCPNFTSRSFDSHELFFSIEQKNPARTQASIVVELPGSLLLPSQGFSQQYPPEPPLRPQYLTVPPRRRSAPGTPGPSVASPSLRDCSSQTSESSDNDRSTSNMQNLPQSCGAPGRQSPRGIPPVPLSQMTIEELMHILPTLDAALIAHDWVPCMQKRQRELKTWLQNNKSSPATESLKLLDKNLSEVFDRSEDIAQTYHQLFDIARKLQERDDQKKDAEIYEATAQKSEALISLSRQISVQEEAAAQHEREITACRDKAHQIIGVLQAFIKTHLQEARRSASPTDLQELLEALFEEENESYYHSKLIRADIYQSLEHTLHRVQLERDGLRDVCTDQSKTIRQQSQQLDQYLDHSAKVVDLLKEKDRQIQKLQTELAPSRSQKQDSVTKNQPQPVQSPKALIPAKTALDEDFDEELWARDAEITNLRRKLDKSLTREKELQNQIKQLVQESNVEQVTSDKPAGLLKRFLGVNQKSSPSIPTMNSMQNLSSTIFTPFTKEKNGPALSPSPRIGRMSPVLPALCDTNTIDHLELPKSLHQPFRSRNRDISPQPPPRIRETPSHDEIDDAVSGRFHQMPSNIRSTTSTSNNLGRPWHMDVLEYAQCSPSRYDGSGLTRSDQSFGQLPTEPYVEGRQMLADRHNRVLSGITELTEEGSASVRRQSAITGSPDSADRQVYLESIDAERALFDSNTATH